jgi:hypothetical protein
MRIRRWWRFGRLGAVAALCACASAACGVFAEQPVIATPTPAVHGNILSNAGFEDGSEPWQTRDRGDWRPFAVSDALARTGANSLQLALNGEAGAEGSQVVGAVQRLNGDAFPEFVAGFYYVDEWQSAETSPYIEFVVTIYGGNHPDGLPVHEARFIIAGASREPFTLLDGQFIFLSRNQPAKGEWTYFSYPILEAIRKRLVWDPAGWESLELSLEVRYDEKPAGEVIGAEVYFDDVYLGSQLLNPNDSPDDN